MSATLTASLGISLGACFCNSMIFLLHRNLFLCGRGKDYLTQTPPQPIGKCILSILCNQGKLVQKFSLSSWKSVAHSEILGVTQTWP